MVNPEEIHASLYFSHYKNDPCFQELLNSKGFIDRRNLDDSRNLEISDCKRIARAFWRAIKDQRSEHTDYSPSNEWIPIFDGSYGDAYGPLHKALSELNYDSLSKILSNFWRESCSAGILGPGFDLSPYLGCDSSFGDLCERSWRMKQFVAEIFYRYSLFLCLTAGDISEEHLRAPNFGNQYGFYLGSKFIPGGSDYQLYYAYRIKNIARERFGDNTIRICELGSGYGGMIQYLDKLIINARIELFDLPIILTMASANLIASVGESSYVRAYGEFDNCNGLGGNLIRVNPCHAVEDLEAKSVDIWFNSYSLSEMSESAINRYLHHIGRTLKRGGVFLNVNHSRICRLGANHYPYAKHGMIKESSTPTLWNLMRLGRGDEVEVLAYKD